jgi:Family of unknown function (DUF5715)
LLHSTCREFYADTLLMRSFVGAIFVIVFPVCLWAGGRDLLVADASSQEIQNARADAYHLSRMKSVAMIQRFASKGYLVAVPSDARFYYLHQIPAQYRYCRPWTKLFLDRLGRQYYAKFGTPLRVTSLIRTVGRQINLARWDGNAADAYGSDRSSHLTGATVDISKHDMSPEAQAWMRDRLYSLRQGGDLYAIEEFYEPVFHVMVYPNFAHYGSQAHPSHSRRREVRRAGVHHRRRTVIPSVAASAIAGNE